MTWRMGYFISMISFLQ